MLLFNPDTVPACHTLHHIVSSLDYVTLHLWSMSTNTCIQCHVSARSHKQQMVRYLGHTIINKFVEQSLWTSNLNLCGTFLKVTFPDDGRKSIM